MTDQEIINAFHLMWGGFSRTGNDYPEKPGDYRGKQKSGSHGIKARHQVFCCGQTGRPSGLPPE